MMANFYLNDINYRTYQLDIDDLPTQVEYLRAQNPTRYLTSAIQIEDIDSNTKELRIVDLHTGTILAGRTLDSSERLVESVNKDAVYHIAKYQNGYLTISKYSASLDIDSQDLINPLTPSLFYSFPAITPLPDGEQPLDAGMVTKPRQIQR
jgi:hypothetical protein